LSKIRKRNLFLHLALALSVLLRREPSIFILLARDRSGDLVPDAQRSHYLHIPRLVLAIQVIQQSATLVHERDQTATGRKILGMLLEVCREVGDAFRHARDLVLGRAGVGLVSAVGDPEFGDALGGEETGGGGVLYGFLLAVEVGAFEDDVHGLALCGGVFQFCWEGDREGGCSRNTLKIVGGTTI